MFFIIIQICNLNGNFDLAKGPHKHVDKNKTLGKPKGKRTVSNSNQKALKNNKFKKINIIASN